MKLPVACGARRLSVALGTNWVQYRFIYTHSILEAYMPYRWLRIWFIIHFYADIIFAIPLFLFPEYILQLAGWQTVDPIATRGVAAALFGIGIESYLGRNSSSETYKNLLNLKIIWSFAATIGLLIALIQNVYNRPLMLWIMFFIFVLFHILWIYWRIQLQKPIMNK